MRGHIDIFRSLETQLLENYGLFPSVFSRAQTSDCVRLDCICFAIFIYLHTNPESYWETPTHRDDIVLMRFKRAPSEVLVEPV